MERDTVRVPVHCMVSGIEREDTMRGLFQAVLRIGDTGVSEEAGALHMYVLLPEVQTAVCGGAGLRV